jgi:hypothetical protein
MKINSTLEKKLLKYSALAVGAVAISTNADAQLFYYDENPDVVLTGNGSMHNIDFDGDLTNDINVATLVASGITGTYAGYSYVANYNAGAAQTTPGNMVVGASSNVNAMSVGLQINASNSFIAADTGAPMGVAGAFVFPAISYTYPIAQGAWLGATDKYMGVKFMIGSATHYGWVRMDLSSDGTTLTVKDWAYNTVADGAIVTGATGVGIESISDDLALVRFNNNRLDVKVVDGSNGNLTVVNTEGKVVYNGSLNSGFESIDLSNLSSGLYIVNAQFNEGAVSHKIVVR